MDAERLARLAAEEERARRSDEELREAHQQAQNAFIDGALKRLERSIREGRSPCLFRVAALDSQYSIFGQVGGSPFSSRTLNELGWDGWEVVGVVPRTTGIPLTNSIGRSSSYGGGIGGIVDGAHLLLRFPVTEQLMTHNMSFLRQVLAGLFDQERSARFAATSASVVTPPVGSGGPGNSGGVAPGAAAAAGGAFFAIGVSHTIEDDSGGEDAGGDFDFGFE
ncbi:MAG: hypothetical protein B7C55_04610 [Actinomycetales bacterium mxb001]|nr:MAG: hypothetical protein B7C55_04610 [Actinomycetales bacterium mxb001]